MTKRWRYIEDRDIQGVIGLWRRCNLTRPWNDPVTDIAFSRRGPSSAVLVWELDGAIAASVMVGHDGHRGTLYYVGVEPSLQKTGLGREVLAAAEGWLAERGCWKINILVRDDNPAALAFWDKMGYRRNAAVSLAKSIQR
jgi:ribosomal protein S18 acetylase RimI-like enzyme